MVGDHRESGDIIDRFDRFRRTECAEADLLIINHLKLKF